MTSRLLRHEQCPACASRGKDRKKNNLGVYDDGHTYCFSCGSSSGGRLNERLHKKEKQTRTIPDLPEDITNKLGREAWFWLRQYFEPKDFPRCLYSSSERKLYFLFPNGGYQYRYFGDNPKHPKWVGYGINDNLIHIEGRVETSSIVLVEDIISAMKVGHTTHQSLCLFGSNISLKRLATIKQLGYDEVIIWLDWDKREYAIKVAAQAQAIGLKARVIHTQLDPKEYSLEKINLFLEKKT